MGFKFLSAKTKYGNRKVVIDGISFDSKLEADYYVQLVLRKKANDIRGFDRQVRVEIVPSVIAPDGSILRAAHYVADFVVEENDGRKVYVDTKGFKTREYRLKKKVLAAYHGIFIHEVYAGGKRRTRVRKIEEVE